MFVQKMRKKSFTTLAEDLRKLRKRVLTEKQIAELNSLLEEPKSADHKIDKKKTAKSTDAEI